MAGNKRQIFIWAIILCVVCAVLSLCLGAASLSLGQLWEALKSGPKNTAGYIFWYSRLPRTCACLLAGSALACSGCILQGVLGNKLASPGIIGVNAGAGLTVTVCCALGAVSGWTISVSAFIGAMATAMIVVLLARKNGASRTTVILSGVAMNSTLNALREALVVISPEAAMSGSDFRVGDLSDPVLARLIPAGIIIVLALVVVMTMCNELDVLMLGEETAGSLGLQVKKVRVIFLILSALLAGAAVSFAGILGFVGLLVPHMARRFVGGESKMLVPMSILTGAAFVTVCDVISRLLFAPHELPVGVLMAVIGGPFFMILLFKRKGGHRSA